MRRAAFPGIFFLILICLGSVPVAGASAQNQSIPPSLQPWEGWVLHGFAYRNCPFIAVGGQNQKGDFLCAWPGRLKIKADADQAAFSQHWDVEAPAWIPLPGGPGMWPLDVKVHGSPGVVLAHDGTPSIRLEPGSYEIEGRILWDHRPQYLPVPAADGLLALTVDGRPVPVPERDGNRLLLGRSGAVSRESLDVRVYRKLQDGVPATLDTRIRIDATGQSREQVFKNILPKDFAPLRITGALPARLDQDGTLHVQLQPGSWTLSVDARDLQPLKKITRPATESPWPEQEIWSYAAAPRLRVTSVRKCSVIRIARATDFYYAGNPRNCAT